MLRFKSSGYFWECLEEFAPDLEPVWNSPGNSVDADRAKVLSIHTLGGREYYIHRYEHTGGALPFASLFSPAGRREWKIAGRLAQLGIPIVRPLAFGRRWELGFSRTAMITESFPGHPVHAGTDLCELVAFIHRMHERGVLARNLRPQSFLAHPVTGELRLALLQDVSIKYFLSARQRARNLACLRSALPIPVTEAVAELCASMRRSNLFRKARSCFQKNPEITTRQIGGLAWNLRQEPIPPRLLGLLENLDEALSDPANLLKSSRSATVARAQGYVIKRYNFIPRKNLTKDLFRLPRAHRAFQKAYHLELAGIPTARAVAAAEERRWGFPYRSYFIMEEIPGAKWLLQWEAHSRNRVCRTAELIANLHNEGFFHRDLKQTNLLSDADGRLYLIDLEGLSYVGSVPPRKAVQSLRRLQKETSRSTSLSQMDRISFLRRYCSLRRFRPLQLLKLI